MYPEGTIWGTFLKGGAGPRFWDKSLELKYLGLGMQEEGVGMQGSLLRSLSYGGQTGFRTFAVPVQWDRCKLRDNDSHGMPSEQ